MSEELDKKMMDSLAKNGGVVVFTCTWYKSTNDLRFKQCLSTLSEMANHCIPTVVVDGSPCDEVHAALLKIGTVVTRQTYKGGKGAALREAADVASTLPCIRPDTLLCWQEPEKTNMAKFWARIRPNAKQGDADIIVPHRNQRSFKKCYPIEQYHSETYGNFYLDCVMKEALATNEAARGPTLNNSGFIREREDSEEPIPSIDWHFGPFAFKSKHLKLWSTYTGNSYDAQLVPIVHGMRRGLTVHTVSVDFQLDEKMKEQEEGNVSFIEKRLEQLSVLDPVVKKSWTDKFYCEM